MPPRTTLTNLPRGCEVCHTCDAGNTVKDRVLVGPTEWSMRCDAGGAFRARHTCHPAKCTLPTPANAELLHGEVWYGRTVTYGLPKRFHRRREIRKRQITPCGLRDGRLERILFCFTSAFVGNIEYVDGESAAHECQHVYTTKGLALGGISSQAVAQQALSLPLLPSAVLGFHTHDDGVAAPLDERGAHHGHGSCT